MAVIGKIRRRSGLLIIIIGLAMLAFILGDIFGNGGLMGQNQVSKVGEIAGAEIDALELEKSTAYWSEIRTKYYGGITNEQARSIAWDDLLYNKVLLADMESNGFAFTAEEYDDLRFGEGALPEFTGNEAFKGEDGTFDPGLVAERYKYFKEQLPDLWGAELYRVKRTRLTDKFNNLVSKTLIANSLEAGDSYAAKNSSMDISYVLKRYSAIADSSITISDSDLQGFFNAHKSDSKYKQTAGRDIELVSFDVIPTQEDIDMIREEVLEYKEDFAGAGNDSIFCVLKSDVKRYAVSSFTRADMDSVQANEVFAAADNAVVGPYEDGTVFRLYKVIGDDSKDEATVRHILIKSDPINDAEMSARADSILRAVKRGADFEALVEKYTDDPGSKATGGKYEWFPKGQMVPEFENFAFDEPLKAKGVVKTSYGYHIMENLERRSEPQKNVVEFVKNIEPSKATFDMAYDKASAFSIDNSNLEAFRTASDEAGMTIKNAASISAGARSVSGINNARELVRWAYDTDRSVGDISEPLEIDERFVVAVLTGSREEGEPIFADIMDDLRPEVLNEKKAEMIEAEIGSYTGLDEVASALGQTVTNAGQISRSTANITGAGSEPKVVGTAFGFTEGDILLPIRGNLGVYVVQIDKKSEADTESVDLSSEMSTLQSTLRNTVNSQMNNALNKARGVKNEIDRIY